MSAQPLPPAQREHVEADIARTRAAIEVHEKALDRLWTRLRILAQAKTTGAMTIAQRQALLNNNGESDGERVFRNVNLLRKMDGLPPIIMPESAEPPSEAV